MVVRKLVGSPLRSRRNRYRNLFPEALENRMVLSDASLVASAASTIALQTNYEEYHVPGSYPAWLTPGPQGVLPQDNGSTGPYGYTPSQIRAAYGVSGITFGSTTGDGTGQTIAIVDAYDNPDLIDSSASNFSSSDLAQFDHYFGLPDPPSFTKYNEYGSTTGLPGTDPKGVGTDNWEVEEALDVEWAHAIAPGASIDLIECNSLNDLYQGVSTAATLSGVSVVSMSWGVAGVQWRKHSRQRLHDSDRPSRRDVRRLDRRLGFSGGIPGLLAQRGGGRRVEHLPQPRQLIQRRDGLEQGIGSVEYQRSWRRRHQHSGARAVVPGRRGNDPAPFRPADARRLHGSGPRHRRGPL